MIRGAMLGWPSLALAAILIGFHDTQAATSGPDDDVYITQISPRIGSLAGETRITIFGNGFAKNQFNFGADSHVGNRVDMVSETRVFPCEVHKDGSHETQIMCYTVKMPEDFYGIRVSIDGELVAEESHCRSNRDLCNFRTHPHLTPLIYSLAPFSNPPKNVVSMRAMIVTDLFEQNVAEATNGRAEEFKRVYNNGQLCSLRVDDTDELYRLELDNENSNWGYIDCKTGGSYVGNQNVSFIISGTFGRSSPDPRVLKLTGLDTLAMYQTYAEIYNVTPSVGSVAGGTPLTIYGQYFDQTDAPAEVLVGEEPCEVTEVTPNRIVCLTPPSMVNIGHGFQGNRGWNMDVFNDSSLFATEMEKIGNLTNPAFTLHRDGAYYLENEMNYYLGLFKGYFIPPKDSEYRFLIKGDDTNYLYLSPSDDPMAKRLVAHASFTASYAGAGISDEIYLEKDRRYYMEVAFKEGGGTARSEVAVKMLNTQYSHSQSEYVVDEKQIIEIASEHKDDIQMLSFDNWATQSSSSEVQVVEVTSDFPSDATFRLGMYGVYTELLTLQSSAGDVQDALNKLVTLPHGVSVTAATMSGTMVLTITFGGDTGTYPLMEVLTDRSLLIDVRSNTTRDTDGTPSLNSVVLIHEGIPSSPILYTELDEDTVADAIEEMHSVRCPVAFLAASGNKYFEDYESSDSYHRHLGDITSEMEPFCGRYSAKNPDKIFMDASPAVMVDSNKYLCFAYKGYPYGHLRVNFLYNADGERNLEKNRNVDAGLVEHTEWKFKCVNLLDMIKNIVDEALFIRVENIRIFRQQGDLYVDTVYMGPRELVQDIEGINHYMRLVPSRWLLDEFEVVGDKEEGFDISITSLRCQDDIGTIGIAFGNETAISRNVTEFRSMSWPGNATAVSTKLQEASPPVTGGFDIKYRNQTLYGVPLESTSYDMARLLETLRGTGNVLVEREGHCAGYTWTVTFHTTGGNHPQMEVDVSNLEGEGVEGEVRTVSDGGAMFDTIPGDLLRTYHETPQVTVKINGIPSRCEGDCGFDWSETQTANMTIFTPTEGTAGTTLTITGADFDDSATAANQVTIGGVDCDVTSVSTTEIQCTIGEGLSGTYDVMVTVLSAGLARDNSGGQFSYMFEVDNISPLSGSNAGGTVITVEGSAFSDNVTVTMDANVCEVSFTNYSTIICITPQGSGTVAIEVSSGNETISNNTFVYNAPTAVVTLISPTTGIVGANVTFNITGSGFGNQSETASVLLGEISLEITSWTSTMIETVLPSMPPGSYPLQLYLGSEGYANVSAVDDIVYTLVIHSMEPNVGSVNGGTAVTITGEGFPDTEEEAEVNIGEVECRVTAISSTHILCDVRDPGAVHVIRNTGISPEFGAGYAWDPMVVDALVGDFVQWEWTTADLIASVDGYVIEQTQTAFSRSYSGGFQSSTVQTRNGGYQRQFNRPGTYYYWSNRIDTDGTIDLRGVVNVHSQNVRPAGLSLTVGGIQAELNVSSNANARRKRDVSCTEATSSCESESENTTSSDSFTFTFSECLTPEITDMYVNDANETGTTNVGTVNDTLTILGTGFGDLLCQNDVFVDTWSCTVLNSTTTRIECQLDRYNLNIDTGVPYLVKVYVNNFGEALNTIYSDIARTFTLLPNIEDIYPKNGSLLGGTRLNITGYGFTDQVYVTILGTPCIVTSASVTQIECITTRAWEGSGEVDVSVITVSGQAVPAVCTGDCTYAFSEEYTPVVHSFTPANVSEGVTTLNISGSGFFVTSPEEVSIYLGVTQCTGVSIGTDSLECELTYPIAGNGQELSVQVPRGYSDFNGSSTMDVSLVFDSISPSAGSTMGNTYVTLTGLGFDLADSEVQNMDCEITFINRTTIMCQNNAGSGSVYVSIRSGSLTTGTQTFTYDSSYTPTISAVSQTSGNSGDNITLTGTNLAPDETEVSVTIDGVPCEIMSASNTEVACTLGAHSAGTFNISAAVQSLGQAIVDVTFTYDLAVSSISPSTGSFGGEQTVTINGNGFDATSTSVLICNTTCDIQQTPSPTEVICTSPANSGSGTVSCDVFVDVAGRVSDVITDGFTYDDSLTPTVTDVTPNRGGTGGGTTVTITGTGFGSDQTVANVSIAGSECVISSLSATEIVCVTEAHSGSVESFVRVELNSDGIAKPVDAGFEYVDLWSSTWTWGGNGLPVEGDLVAIPSTMTVVLDTDTPILKLLLIQGGRLIFDEVNVTLNAEIILITDGGLLQVGTEEEPFQHSATIMMHGHVRSKELPIYGSKTLAVREGTLDLHGIPVGTTWTRLADTASADDRSINVQTAVEWPVGSEIVIASTGDMKSMPQNEKRRIVSKSNGDTTLTLDSPLVYEHLGETVDVTDGVTLEARAEVGLLSHNIVVRGSDDDQWHDKITACKAGFNTGEFATQTCFQGRFGEEVGTDQYGSQIMFHAPRPNEGLVLGRIENVEITYAGQAFRMGRYAIHFHLNGNMNGSYVRSCGIHKSFNRAVNIHGTHQVLVEHTVIYDIMGGAFFFEDGIETGNIWQYNLAVFVKSSSSLQNADITPAAFWVTNPNNTVRHNAAAGGSHFGFWYRLNAHPEGPSLDHNYCIQNVELGEFYNNTVHSQGWFGLWIFEAYFPKKGGTLDGGTCQATEPAVANFERLITWNCEKGAEATNMGSVHFTDFLMVNNKINGIEVKNLGSHPQDYGDDAPMVRNSVIAAEAGVLNNQVSSYGVVLPLARGFRVNSTTFVNYDSVGQGAYHSASITGTSGPDNGGFTHWLQDITYDNSPYKAHFKWKFDTVLYDVDGTTTGIVGGTALPTMNTLPTSDCNVESDFSGNSNVPGSVCSGDVVAHRFSFNNPNPSSLFGRNVVISNRYGTDVGIFQRKRMTHKFGWMILLVDGEVTDFYFENSQHITNLSYHGIVYDLEGSDHVIISQNLTQHSDMFSITGDFRNASQNALTYADSYYGDWTFDDVGHIFEYIVSGRDANHLSGRSTFVDRRVDLEVYQCYFLSCIIPVEGGGDEEETPDELTYWSDVESWSEMEEGWGGNYGDGQYGLPIEGDDIHIPDGMWMVLDVEDIPLFNKIYITGVLEFSNEERSGGGYYDLTLNAKNILIMGGRFIVGTEDEPYKGNASIVLRGGHNSEEMLLNYGPVVGAKAMGVFGGLDLHGTNTTQAWTKLASTVAIRDDNLTLADPVDWPEGAEIIVTTTGMSPYEAETGRIVSKSGDNLTLTLDINFQHKHIAVTERVNNQDIVLAAEVGLLSRNVRVVGEEHESMFSQLFGARVLVGSMLDDDGNPHQGYARLSNVEFYRGGQEGFTDNYDPRYTLAFLNIGDATDEFMSYVKECSFNWNFSPAIGVFGTNHLHIGANVIYHTIGSSIVVEGSDTVLSRNLMAEIYFPGAYNGRFEAIKLTWDAGIEINNAGGHVHMYDNVVAGSERGGYHVDGQVCGEVESDPSLLWRRNEAHSVLIGVELYPQLTADGVGPCLTLNGFKVWKAYDFGIYSQTPYPTKVSNLISVDNNVGVLIIVIGPSATGHVYDNKFAHITNSTIVGTSSAFDCETDVLDLGSSNMIISAQSRSWRTESGGKVGISWSNFNSGSNNACIKPFKGLMSYQAIRGKTTIADTTFANYATSCGDRADYAITTNPGNEDFQHSMSLERITLENARNKVFIHRPSVGKINPADCVDMDCDAKKKALLRDEDGSFLGSAVAAIIPQSEWEWDGDPRRGLGDYRIPKTLITDTDGNRLDVDTVAPHLGIHRDGTCRFNDIFQAYECNGPDYLNVHLESLDWDTETRRLSPVALLSDDGYLDLINGPQDHGWCSGYTCQKRLSTFPLTVATAHYYIIHYSGTAPQDSRIHLLNADDTQAVVFGIWYSQPWRLDVSVGGAYVKPTNGYYDADGRLLFEAPVADEFMPDVTSDPSGTNYYDRAEGILHVLVRGSQPVTIITSPLILVTFNMPSLTVDEFFGENIVSNLAAFYDLPPEKIRIAEAVRESRRKRATGIMTITLEISDTPSANATTSNSTSSGNNTIAAISSSIINAYQMGQMGDILGVEVLSMSIVEPPPDTSSETWDVMAETGELSVSVELLVPDEMQFVDTPVPTHEGTVFSTPPVLQMQDPTNAVLSQVGSLVVPWVVEVTLLTNGNSDSEAILLGATSAEFGLGGTASFADLAISHGGEYALSFEVVSPVEASSFTVETSYFTVTEKVLSGVATNYSESVEVGELFEISSQIIDSFTLEAVEDIAWRNHTWTCTVSASSLCRGDATFTGNTTVAVDPFSNMVTFEVTLDSPGMCPLQFTYESTPDDYYFTVAQSIMAYPENYVAPQEEVSKEVVISFDADFSTHGSGYEEQIKAAVYNTFWTVYPNTTWSNFDVYAGSIVVQFSISGMSEAVTGLLDTIRSEIAGPLVLDYGAPSTVMSVNVMHVDGEEYGSPEAESGSASNLTIIGIAIGCVVAVLLVVGIVILVVKYKANKTGKSNLSLNSGFTGKKQESATWMHSAEPTTFPDDLRISVASERFQSPVVPDHGETPQTSPEPSLGSHSSMRSEALVIGGAVPPAATYYDENGAKRSVSKSPSRSPFASHKVSPAPQYDLPQGLEPAREVTSDELYGRKERMDTLSPGMALEWKGSTPGDIPRPRSPRQNRISPLQRTVTDLDSDLHAQQPILPIAFDGYVTDVHVTAQQQQAWR